MRDSAAILSAEELTVLAAEVEHLIMSGDEADLVPVDQLESEVLRAREQRAFLQATKTPEHFFTKPKNGRPSDHIRAP